MSIGDPALFPFRHDWSAPFKVTREWLTDVQTADDGTEVRASIRSAPHLKIAMRGVFLTEMGAGTLLAQWRGASQPLRYYAPLWCDATDLTTAVTAGDAIIECDTTTRPFFAIDAATNVGYAMLYREPVDQVATAEVITYETVDDGLLTLATGTTSSYAVAGTRVIPCRVMWLPMPQQVTWLSGRIATADISFVEEVAQAAYQITDTAGTATPASISISLDRRAVSLDGVTKVCTARAIVEDADGVPLDASRLAIVWSKVQPGGTSVRIVPSINAEYARCEYISGSIVAGAGVTATLGALSDMARF